MPPSTLYSRWLWTTSMTVWASSSVPSLASSALALPPIKASEILLSTTMFLHSTLSRPPSSWIFDASEQISLPVNKWNGDGEMWVILSKVIYLHLTPLRFYLTLNYSKETKYKHFLPPTALLPFIIFMYQLTQPDWIVATSIICDINFQVISWLHRLAD